ncbi:MAG: DUF3618 domain-containing protein [Phenylobacterium sp.]|uniref:DUF3618 domain-containing protein n=1 Tax=Phenylobacterium sp. TaxID=1871053 RepID=UPI001A46FBB6|nr:DUF3618 domain-containing protein [Phenylobacterium sp.]MBL8554095.1 DUF3618 domain-containing protein [Phenylobacterium sp.]
MTKTSADIEREVEETRGRIDRTVEALREKVQEPRELFDEATRMMNGASNKVLTTAVEQLKENPIPVALVGLGLAWLAVAQVRGPRTSGSRATADGYYPTYEGYDGEDDESVRARVRARAEQAKAKLAHTAEAAKARLSQATHAAGDTVSDARGKAGEIYGAAREKAGEYGDYARRRFDHTLDAEPLVIGALGLAVGAAIGASLPSTPVERRHFGPARAKAAEAAKARIGEVQEVAARAYGQVRDELHRQTGPAGEGASLRDKASAIAEAGTRAVKDEIAGAAK